jgi:hypothetical protein
MLIFHKNLGITYNLILMSAHHLFSKSSSSKIFYPLENPQRKSADASSNPEHLVFKMRF